MMNFNFINGDGGGMVVLLGGFWVLTAIVHIAFAIAVLTDSDLLWRRLRRKTFLVGGGISALATLLGGVFVAAVYWVIHHSSLRARPEPGEESGDATR